MLSLPHTSNNICVRIPIRPSVYLPSARYLFQPIDSAIEEQSLPLHHPYVVGNKSNNMTSSAAATSVHHNIYSNNACYDESGNVLTCDAKDSSLLTLPIIDFSKRVCHIPCILTEYRDKDSDSSDAGDDEEIQRIFSDMEDVSENQSLVGDDVDDWTHPIADIELNTNHDIDFLMSSLCSLAFGMSYRTTMNVEDIQIDNDEGLNQMMEEENDAADQDDPFHDVIGEIEDDDDSKITSLASANTVASPTCIGIETQESYENINQRRHELWKQSLKTSLFHSATSSASAV
jgi:hypothetical protein